MSEHGEAGTSGPSGASPPSGSSDSSSEAPSERRFDYDRTVALSDGVFAIALTLLVLNIGAPELGVGHEGVLGAFQVSVTGDLANWHTGAPDAIPAVGGAMDLAIGAKRVYVMMEHLTKKGESKIVARCSYPLTGVGCVNRIFTDLAVLDVTSEGLKVLERAPDLSFEELQRLTGVPLIDASAALTAEPVVTQRREHA